VRIKEFWSKVYQKYSDQKLNTLLTKINQIGTVDRKPGSGKMCKMQIAGNINSVKKLVLSQENALRKRKTFPTMVSHLVVVVGLCTPMTQKISKIWRVEAN